MTKVSERGLKQIGPVRASMKYDELKHNPFNSNHKPWKTFTKKRKERIAAYQEKMAKLFTRLPPKTEQQKTLNRAELASRQRRSGYIQVSLPKIDLPDYGDDDD